VRNIAKIVLVFFIIFSLVPAQGWAAGKKKKIIKKKERAQAVVPAPAKKFLDFKIVKEIWPRPPFQEGEEIAILREEVKVIVRDNANDIHEGWVPAGTVVVVKGQEQEIIRLYKNGVPVLNKVLLKDLQRAPQTPEGEKLRLIPLLRSQEREKEEKGGLSFLFPQKKEEPLSTSSFPKKEKKCVDWGTGFSFAGAGATAYGLTRQESVWTGIGFTVNVTALVYGEEKPICKVGSVLLGGFVGWVIGELTKPDDKPGGGGAGGGGSAGSDPPP